MISEVEAPLLDDFDVQLDSVDYKGRPSVRSKSGCWKSSAFIIGVGVAERFAYYGISSNLLSYLSGCLGQPTATAASLLNAFYGIASLLPIVGAFVADSFSGRYRMIISASVFYILGLIFLSTSASLNSFNSVSAAVVLVPNNLQQQQQLQIVFFFFSLYLVALSQGGVTPCIQAFGADQFDENNEKEFKAKSSFFNWMYCCSVGGILVPLLVLTYIQENLGWVLGFGIPAAVMFLTLIVFLVGTPFYRFPIKNDNAKNPVMRIFRVFFQAARNWRAETTLHQENTRFKFLEKALIVPTTKDGLCSIEDVKDATSILRLIPIWCTAMGYSIVYAQPSTLFTKQATTLDRHLFTSSYEIPAASLQQFFISGSIMVFIPIYDRVFVPIARSITKKPSGISMLLRIGIGLLLSLLSMVYAAIIEKKRLATAVEYGLQDMPNIIIPMSAWWLAPQYVLSGIADVFTMIGLQEFFYDQIPGDLKSIGLAMYLSILGVGSLSSSLLVSSVENVTKGRHNQRQGWFADNLNRAHLDYFYWLLAGLSVFEFAAYVYFSRSYVNRKKD
ncbi:hypothetical protein ACJIZ3_017268 [Penstemon smallii]|uniref:Uncharacterized protein n=1 Tax=Penstemon smallii TaxID=265156 RepID=A0ABD3SVN9_9LAMI